MDGVLRVTQRAEGANAPRVQLRIQEVVGVPEHGRRDEPASPQALGRRRAGFPQRVADPGQVVGQLVGASGEPGKGVGPDTPRGRAGNQPQQVRDDEGRHGWQGRHETGTERRPRRLISEATPKHSKPIESKRRIRARTEDTTTKGEEGVVGYH